MMCMVAPFPVSPVEAVLLSTAKENTMLKRTSLLISIILFSTLAVVAQIESPKSTPVASNENQQRLITEGIALHDQKNYDAAISKYEEALKENPDNVLAIYEIGFSYFEKKDYKKSLEIAYRGARYKSELLPRFYVLAGNSLDNLGDSKKALEIYKSGIKISPNTSLLHLNLGITYKRLDKPEEARKSFKRAAALAPNYSSSHLHLGDLFYKGNYRVPAMLAMARFLVLEPNTERSDIAYRIFQEILGGSARAGDKPNEVNIFVSLSDKKDEGDFGGVDMMLGLTKAADFTEENKGKTKGQLAVEQLESLFAMMSELNDKENKSKFVWKYYVPYFSEMKQKKYVEPFYYYISRRNDDPEVKKWLDGNFRRVNEFLNWSKQYQWPRIDD